MLGSQKEGGSLPQTLLRCVSPALARALVGTGSVIRASLHSMFWPLKVHPVSFWKPAHWSDTAVDKM